MILNGTKLAWAICSSAKVVIRNIDSGRMMSFRTSTGQSEGCHCRWIMWIDDTTAASASILVLPWLVSALVKGKKMNANTYGPSCL